MRNGRNLFGNYFATQLQGVITVNNNHTIQFQKNINFTTDINEIKKCNIFIITVPTPITKFKSPDQDQIFIKLH